MNRALAILALLLLGYGAWVWLWRRPSGAIPGPAVDVRADPIQEELAAPRGISLERGGRPFTVELTHRYQVSGHVLSAAHYNVAWTNDFFDVDLGLVWGPRVEDLLERYTFTQDGRWLFWRSNTSVDAQERAYITEHIGNEHLIPMEGNRRVDLAIRWVEPGDEVRVDGYLVQIKDENGRLLLKSSTSRADSGGGACEVVWVEQIQIGEKVYR